MNVIPCTAKFLAFTSFNIKLQGKNYYNLFSKVATIMMTINQWIYALVHVNFFAGMVGFD